VDVTHSQTTLCIFIGTSMTITMDVKANII
jgi:hypothetical protein